MNQNQKMRELAFPKTYPEDLKSFAKKYYSFFYDAVCPEEVEYYIRFIEDVNMKEFWDAVLKNMPLEHPLNGQVVYTAESAFAQFLEIFRSWFSDFKPLQNRSKHIQEWKRLQNKIRSLKEDILKSDNFVKENINHFFHEALDQKISGHVLLSKNVDSDKENFSDVLNWIDGSMHIISQSNLCTANYIFLPKKVKRKNEGDSFKNYFMHNFIDLVIMAYGGAFKPKKVLDVLTCVIPDLNGEIEADSISKCYNNKI